MIQDNIKQFIEFTGITPYKFCKDLGLSMGYLDKKGAIGTDKYLKIIEYYPEINPEWLLTGNGSMLKSAVKKEVQGLDPPDTGHYKELAAARLEIIEGLKFKVATLEKELYVLKLTQGDPIVNEIVAKPAPELIKK